MIKKSYMMTHFVTMDFNPLEINMDRAYGSFIV
ncbi:hypothetical protein BC670_3402 [Flavobacterium branchiophilum]|uniref:Uncharacterized protein n=1 Tax=Flavobacterium branchiophilum TaxID=55197 RepID=A0A543G8D8_9FLAO|nr:hypothetical protein BC670_3402 [Flavobacterium branchiophilum]